MCISAILFVITAFTSNDNLLKCTYHVGIQYFCNGRPYEIQNDDPSLRVFTFCTGSDRDEGECHDTIHHLARTSTQTDTTVTVCVCGDWWCPKPAKSTLPTPPSLLARGLTDCLTPPHTHTHTHWFSSSSSSRLPNVASYPVNVSSCFPFYCGVVW